MKDELIKILDNFFTQLGFKKQNSLWSFDNGILIKKVNLQKSDFGEIFYLNYGYDIKNLNSDLDSTMDIYNRAGTINHVDDLQSLINEVSNNFNSTNSEEDILSSFEKRPTINDIPLNIKKYFKLT